MFQVGLPMLPGIELRPVSLNKRQQKEEALFQKHTYTHTYIVSSTTEMPDRGAT